MERTGTFNALADGILNDVAANLGYSREELDRVAREMGMEDELLRLVLDAICCEASRDRTWRNLTFRAANEIAGQVAAREFETGLKIDMTKGE